MSRDDVKKELDDIKELLEINIQQRSGHHSDILRKIEEINLSIEAIKSHPMFQAYEDGKVIIKIMKFVAYIVGGIVGFLVILKTGGEIIKGIIK